MKNDVPSIIMFHSVGSNKTTWCDKALSVDATSFDYFCHFLSSNHYKTEFLAHWYYLQDNPGAKSKKDIFLTFDDGYLDNLLVAYPILKKYGLKATIFVNPEFVDPSSGIRTLDERDGNTLGFLNWDEICFLDKSGVFDIQSHSMSHNFYFSSNVLIDIYEAQDKYHWIPWIASPDRKSYWQYEDQTQYVKLGAPVFQFGRALGERIYFPDEKFISVAESLYKQGLPKQELLKKLNQELTHFPGHYESDEEKEKRFWYELFNSKHILEQKLQKKVKFLCWPGGGYDDMSVRISKEAGYLASTTSSKDKKEYVNENTKYKRMRRLGIGSTTKSNGKMYMVHEKRYLTWRFLASFQQNVYYKILLKIYVAFIVRLYKLEEVEVSSQTKC